LFEFKEKKMKIINELNDFINQTKNAKKIKKTLAVKIILEATYSQKIIKSLALFHGLLVDGKNQAIFEKIESLMLQYKGTQSHLKP
jgi:hypothetical protein